MTILDPCETITAAALDERLPRYQARLFDAVDAVSLDRARLALAAYQAHAQEPIPIKRAATLEHVLAGMQLDLTSNPIFAGCTAERPRAWMLVPECGFGVDQQVLIEQDLITRDWYDRQIPEDLRAAWAAVGQYRRTAGVGHISIDYGLVVERGLEAIIEAIAAQPPGSPAQDAYRAAMARSCRAVIAWAGRWAAAADDAAATCADPVEAACHRRVAAACRRVPAKPARNLFEGLQAMTLIHLAMVVQGEGLSLSIGSPDRVLARFADEVAADPALATAWVRAFLLKIAANSLQGRGSKTQCITLGGSRADGSDACNAITGIFLAAYAATPVADPHCFFRWHAAVDEPTWARVVDLLAAGRSMPMLVNDHQVMPGLRAAGIDPAHAAAYCVIGCNELGIPGRMNQSAIAAGLAVNDLAIFDAVMRDPDADRTTADGFLAAVGRRLRRRYVAGYVDRLASTDDDADTMPMPLTSALCHGCIEAGDDALRAMPYQRMPGVYVRGTSNVVNGLVALDALVWRGELSMSAFIARLDAHDPELLAAIAALPKWGNDDPRADRWMTAWSATRRQAVAAMAATHGLPAVAVCHVVRSLHHLDGRGIGPTADGRAAGTAVADSIGPVCGTASEGPTAQLCSVLGIDGCRDYLGIYNHNLSLTGPQARPPYLRAMIEGFFGDGGQELQINVLDVEQLKAAKADPRAYADLVVRIAGLNARFCELSAMEQDEIIRRAESAAGG